MQFVPPRSICKIWDISVVVIAYPEKASPALGKPHLHWLFRTLPTIEALIKWRYHFYLPFEHFCHSKHWWSTKTRFLESTAGTLITSMSLDWLTGQRKKGNIIVSSSSVPHARPRGGCYVTSKIASKGNNPISLPLPLEPCFQCWLSQTLLSIATMLKVKMSNWDPQSPDIQQLFLVPHPTDSTGFWCLT